MAHEFLTKDQIQSIERKLDLQAIRDFKNAATDIYVDLKREGVGPNTIELYLQDLLERAFDESFG